MFIRRLFLAAIGLATLIPAPGCCCHKPCSSSGSMSPAPCQAPAAPPPGYIPPYQGP
jgi:hypothetical protein